MGETVRPFSVKVDSDPSRTIPPEGAVFWRSMDAKSGGRFLLRIPTSGDQMRGSSCGWITSQSMSSSTLKDVWWRAGLCSISPCMDLTERSKVLEVGSDPTARGSMLVKLPTDASKAPCFCRKTAFRKLAVSLSLFLNDA